MRLLNDLALALLSVNAFLTFPVHSAPTTDRDTFSLVARNETSLTQPEDVPSVAYFWDEDNSDNHLHRRDSYPDILTEWDLWNSHEEAVAKNPAATANKPVPYDVPKGRKAKASLSRKRYRYQHYEGCDVTERTVKLLTVLGNGTYGTVYNATLSIPGQSGTQTVAVKMATADPGGLINGAMLEQSIPSDNVVSVTDYFYVDATQAAFLIMPLAAGGDLNNHIIDYYGQGQATINKMFRQALVGVQAMHSPSKEYPYGIMHRDLKPENILVDGGVLKIADFDAATSEGTSYNWLAGSPGFMAPEIMRAQLYNKKVDVFSMGVTWLVMSLPDLWSTDGVYGFWKAILSPRDGQVWLSAQKVYGILIEKFGNDLTKEMRILASKVLCEPSSRLTMDQFVLELDRLPK